MARRLNTLGLSLIVVLCILLIFASNRIPLSPFSSSPTAPENEIMRNLVIPRESSSQYRYSNFENENENENSFVDGSQSYANNYRRHSSKYNRIMHPHKTDGRLNGRKFDDTATAQTSNVAYVNSTERIEDVLNAQRRRVKNKMRDFEFTEQMGGGLKALTPETGGRPLQSCELF